jgi:hypothetical protein
MKTRIHFLDDFSNYAEAVFTHYKKFKQQTFLVVRQCLMKLGLTYNESTEILDAFWRKLPTELQKPRIVDFVPFVTN